MILGTDWLEHHNPDVNWEQRTLGLERCPPSCIIEDPPVRVKSKSPSRPPSPPPRQHRDYHVRWKERSGIAVPVRIVGGQRRRSIIRLQYLAFDVPIPFTENDDERFDVPQEWSDTVFNEMHEQELNEPDDAQTLNLRALFAGDAAKKPEEPKPLKEQIPRQYHRFLLVFDKKTAERLPARGVWDHAIKLKQDFVPKPSKTYPLSPAEDADL